MKVGLIGAGTIAEHHLRALRRIPGAVTAGILDIRPGVARALASRHGVPHSFEEPEAFYGGARPEIVHVLTPPATHHAVATEALRRGVHVLVEKPMALTVSQCREMAAAAGSAGVTLGVDHTMVFDPRVRAARGLLDGGALGDLIHVETVFGFDVRRSPHIHAAGGEAGGWVEKLPGGLLEDLLPHPLSVTLHFLDAGAELAGSSLERSGRLDGDHADELRLALQDGKTTAAITLSLSLQPDLFTVTLYGSRETVRMDIPNMLLQRLRLRRLPKPLARGILVAETSLLDLLKTAWNVASIAIGRGTPPGDVAPLLRAHHDAVRSGAPVPVGVEEGTRAVEIIRRLWPVQEPAGASSAQA